MGALCGARLWCASMNQAARVSFSLGKGTSRDQNCSEDPCVVSQRRKPRVAGTEPVEAVTRLKMG